jgi:hypothetical protein
VLDLHLQGPRPQKPQPPAPLQHRPQPVRATHDRVTTSSASEATRTPFPTRHQHGRSAPEAELTPASARRQGPQPVARAQRTPVRTTQHPPTSARRRQPLPPPVDRPRRPRGQGCAPPSGAASPTRP